MNLENAPAPDNSPAPDPIFQRCDLCARYPYTLREYVRRATWNLVRVTLFRWSPRGWRRWRNFLLRRFGARIGPNSHVRRSCRIFHPWLLELGDWSSLGDDVEMYNLGPVTIGTHSVISQMTYVCAGTHDYTLAHLPLLRPPIHIGSGVWIAAQAFIGPGVTVGDNSVIGARSVVTRDIPPGVVAAGNPAQARKPRTMNRGANPPA